MATIDVKDAAGDTVAVEKPNANGRAAAAASRPVALSTEDKTALDAVATSAKQDAIITALGTLGTQATSAAILAKLIAAPATEAKQDSTITAIATIGTRAYGAAATRLAYAGTSAQSATITATEVLLHNCGTARCYVKAASNPTATTDDIPIEAGEKFHLRITSGHKIAAIQDSAGGNLNIIPVA